MIRNATWLLLAMLVACAPVRDRPLYRRELSAVHSAEAFIARHGYTEAGHPANLPVENAEVLDSISTREQLVEWRKGTLQSKAFGIAQARNGAYYVYFHRLKDPSSFRAVLVEDGNAVQVAHTPIELDWLPWVPVRSE